MLSFEISGRSSTTGPASDARPTAATYHWFLGLPMPAGGVAAVTGALTGVYGMIAAAGAS